MPKRTVELSDNPGSVRLAGRYVAYVVGARNSGATSPERAAVVCDWVAGTEVYRARASSAVPLPGDFRFDRFDLQADGTLVAASARRDPYDQRDDPKPPCEDSLGVAWYSPAEPQAHLLPLKACSTRVRIGSDRIAFFRRLGERGSQLVTSDLAGASVTPVAEFAHEGLVQAFDFDGVRAGFAVRGCVDPSLYVEAAQPATPARFARPDCPMTIAGSAGRVSRGGRALVKVGCPAGCREIDGVLSGGSGGGGSGSGSGRLAAGKTRTFALQIPGPMRARLARGLKQRALVRATHSTFDAASSYSVPRRASFARAVTILPR